VFSYVDFAKIGLAVSFLFYGWSCIYSKRMAREFDRFQLSKLRLLIGSLEIAGAAGILVGYQVPILGFLSTLGLAVLMAAGVVLRLRLKDPFLDIVPAAFFMCLAAWILMRSVYAEL